MALAGSNRKPALTAAARKISYQRADTTRLKEETWQERAWTIYDSLPAVFYMTRYRSDIASKMEYFVGTVSDPSEDPEVDDGTGSKVLENEGGPELLRRLCSELVVHWDVPGEGYLTRFDEEPFWRVLSTQELKKEGKWFIWGDEQNEIGMIDADNVFRVWDPHPRFHWQADSPTRHILDDAEELILLSREAKARSMSRVSAGVLLLPDSLDLSPYAEDEAGTEDDVARWLMNVLAGPVRDPTSGGALTPAIMSMHGEDIAKVRHLTFARDWEINLELRRELLRSVATGLDLPPEILTGVADLNHWSAWLVSEMAVSQHVLPTVDAILDSLTVNWFRPLLEAAGVASEEFVLWRDPSAATVPPDQSDVALRAFELGAIGGKAVRRVINMDEEDKMDDEDRANREAGQPQAPAPRNEKTPPERDGIQAAIPGQKFDADIPARIDSDLLAWLIEASHTEIERLVQIAEDAALTAATDPLDESLLDQFAERVDKRIAQAQQKVRGWLSRLIGADISIEEQDAARAAGVPAIVKAVLDHVRARLFTPDSSPDPIDLGEIPDVAVPVKALRDGLSIAGGGLPLFEGQKGWELIGNGKNTVDTLNARGFRTLAYRWEYGLAPRAVEFPPHRALDQREFPSWEAEGLTVTSEASWLARPFFKPGDHAGCLCSYTRILTLSLQLPVAGSV
jgi:hypothetical protein